MSVPVVKVSVLTTPPALKIKVLPKPVVQVRLLSQFPSSVSVLSPILLDRTGGNYTFSFDLNALGLGGVYQPLDSDLTAIAALSTTTYGRSLLTLANATALAAEVDSFFLTPAEGNAAYQPLDSDLTAIAALTTTSYGRAFLALADAAAARTAIGTVIGTDVQGFDSDLAALAANATNGIWARTGAGTGSARTITGTANAIAVTNGDGVSGNPTLAISTDAALPGNPTTTTQPLNNNSTRVSTTAFFFNQVSNATPLGSLATGAAGTSTLWARADHVHPGREVLTANRTYYVRTDGNDSNTGLVNSSGGAFLTIQKAIDISAAIDLGGFTVTIQLGAGTFAGATLRTLVGGNGIIVGDETTPANVAVTSTFTADSVQCRWDLRGMKITSSVHGIDCENGSIVRYQNIDFGAITFFQILCVNNGVVIATGPYKISGSAAAHVYQSLGGTYQCQSRTVTLTGTPAFSTAFIFVGASAKAVMDLNTYSGSATGVRYSITGNGVIDTAGGGASYLPGGTSGSTASGGQYL